MSKIIYIYIIISTTSAVYAFQLPNDPWKKFNKRIFKFNEIFDNNITNPISQHYINLTTPQFRKNASNAIENLNTPSKIIISLTQGDFEAFSILAWRFTINSTIGIFGLFDIAHEMGLERVDIDFTDTLIMLNVKEGNYLILPFLGPSTLRNTAGAAVNFGLDINVGGSLPLSYKVLQQNNTIVGNIAKDELYGYFQVPLMYFDIKTKILPLIQDIDKNSLDKYTAYKIMYAQYIQYQMRKRQQLRKNGRLKQRWDQNIQSASEYCILNVCDENCTNEEQNFSLM